ncbi:hypothetical protein BC749_101153 [Flavobacterium araucananum]|nr:hypothetical protein BC749_101153 [Flavobacterium araucananum]
MTAQYLKTVTLFSGISLVALLGIVVSSTIMISLYDMDQKIQGWVNLLWIPFIIAILIIDRICVRIFGVRKINRIEMYILGTMLLLFSFYRMFIFFSEL